MQGCVAELKNDCFGVTRLELVQQTSHMHIHTIPTPLQHYFDFHFYYIPLISLTYIVYRSFTNLRCLPLVSLTYIISPRLTHLHSLTYIVYHSSHSLTLFRTYFTHTPLCFQLISQSMLGSIMDEFSMGMLSPQHSTY